MSVAVEEPSLRQTRRSRFWRVDINHRAAAGIALAAVAISATISVIPISQGHFSPGVPMTAWMRSAMFGGQAVWPATQPPVATTPEIRPASPAHLPASRYGGVG